MSTSRLALCLLSCLAIAIGASAQTALEVGRPAPDLVLKDSAGVAYDLSSYKGKSAVVLEFFRSGDW